MDLKNNKKFIGIFKDHAIIIFYCREPRHDTDFYTRDTHMLMSMLMSLCLFLTDGSKIIIYQLKIRGFKCLAVHVYDFYIKICFLKKVLSFFLQNN